MVEHLVCNQAVVGSNPVASTKGGSSDGLAARPPAHLEPPAQRDNPNKRSAMQSAFFDI